MNKKKKIILIAGIAIVVIAIIIGIVVAISSNNNEKADERKNTQIEEGKYSWPDLTEYNIPNLEVGDVTDLVDESNKGNYKLNYDISVKAIKHSDLEEYSKKFESTWDVSQNEDNFMIITSDGPIKYSIYITFDESAETAEFTITSL